jgi:hypothetical protein
MTKSLLSLPFILRTLLLKQGVSLLHFKKCWQKLFPHINENLFENVTSRKDLREVLTITFANCFFIEIFNKSQKLSPFQKHFCKVV